MSRRAAPGDAARRPSAAYGVPVGAGHGHGGGTTGRLQVGRGLRIAVLAPILVCALLAGLGVLHWWPDQARLHRAEGVVPVVASGVSVVHGELLRVRPACTGAGGTACGDSSARVLDGRAAGTVTPISLTPDVVGTGLRRGDQVLLFDLTGTPEAAANGAFDFYRADRGSSLVWLAILFAVLVVLVAWRRGALALVSLAFAALVVLGFLIPALLSGRPPVPVTLAASALMLVVILYATHGPSLRTSVALLGALVGLGLSALFAWVGVIGARLGGLGDDSASLLTFNVGWVDVQQLVVASVIVAGLGTLNDVTVTQASAVWELREASPEMPRRDLFRRAMRIGRDHVASTVYTLVFAYLGTALVLLVAVQLYRSTASAFVTAEDVAEEVVRALVGGIALVLAMPVTTGIAVLVAAAAQPMTRRAPAGPYRRSSSPRAAAAASDPFRVLPRDPWDEA